MQNIAIGLFITIIAVLGFFLLGFLIYSYFEEESKAFKRGISIFLFYVIIIVGISFIPFIFYPWLAFFSIIGVFVLLIKFGNSKIDFIIPENRFDERDVMFSRNELKEGTEKFESYYKYRPGNKEADDEFRKEPGLLATGSTFYNEVLFSAANATFRTVNLLQPLAEQSPSDIKTNVSEKELTEFLKGWALKLGAADIGFTNVKPHHIYTHIGRGEAYGKEVELNHQYAIAFTVEMSYKAMMYNPRGPVVMESAQQYLNAGNIAVQLTQFLRNLGFEARAHIDANYRVICPIIAQDAGLGTIGRMGLLMTPKLGARVRIGVVTTNLKLPLNKKPIDYSMIHFCEICKKCSENCPSQSISFRSVSTSKNPERWTIKHESCFTYWCKSGTDCGRCMAVCPYSHPDNFMHNIIRWMIKRNPVNRWFALKLDTYFYGSKPPAVKMLNKMFG
uniref:reductive dehalogenase n=1 Tax=uncultured Draconibacterium sp. TaxID=1573823 RepID=UPI003217027D